MKGSKYLIIAQPVPSIPAPASWEAALTSTVGICHTCKKAYQVSLFLAGITKPDCSYRKILETVKKKGAATVSQVEGEQRATIALTKMY